MYQGRVDGNVFEGRCLFVKLHKLVLVLLRNEFFFYEISRK